MAMEKWSRRSMNERFVAKCKDPVFFESVKYAVHSLEGNSFENMIQELLDINPYLATLCYVTSEYNDKLKQLIIVALEEKAHSSPLSANELALFSLSFDLLGLGSTKEYGRVTHLLTKKKKSQNGNEAWLRRVKPYYLNLLRESLIKQHKLVELSNLNAMTHHDEMVEVEKRNLINSLYAHRKWLLLLYALEQFDLYCFFIDGNENDYIKVLPLAFEKAYRRNSKKRGDILTEQICIAGRKLMTIYILKYHNHVAERYEKIKSITDIVLKDQARKDFASMMRNYFNQYTIENIYAVYDVPKGNRWDVKGNGIDRPYKAYCDDKTSVWWIDDNGQRIKKTIKDIEKGNIIAGQS